jgi:two-component system response regulator FlrC
MSGGSPRGGPAPVGGSVAMREALSAVEDVAGASTTVLLLGESGTGKEVLARYIHALSPRAAGPWVAVNCAALPGELLESELFGHERGAFTGASERRIGKIELADRGTLLLDEISEMPLPLQAKLLRVLQEREVDRVGGGRPVAVDARVIATSNRDLGEMVARREFRADLYYRLCVFPIELPPLRERREDIPALATHLVELIAQRLGRPVPRLAEAAVAYLGSLEYPGNVRELGNALERAILRCRGPVLEPEHFGAAARAAATLALTSAPAPVATATAAAPAADLPLELAELERLAITEALRRVGGNRTHAARLLGISLRTLRNKLRLYRAEGEALAGGQILPAGTEGPGPASPWSTAVARPSQERAA